MILHQGALVGQNGQRVGVLVLLHLDHLLQERRDELQSAMQSQQIASAVFGGLKEIFFAFVVDHRLQIAVVLADLLVLSVVLEYHEFAVHVGRDERKDFTQIVEKAACRGERGPVLSEISSEKNLLAFQVPRVLLSISIETSSFERRS